MKKRKSHRPRNLRPRTPDAAVLDQLRRLRDDLSSERPIHFYLYFPNRENAERAGEELLQARFSVECERSATDSKWLCLATKKMLLDESSRRPDLVDLDVTSTTLKQVAAKLNGEYDGWETQVIQNAELGDCQTD